MIHRFKHRCEQWALSALCAGVALRARLLFIVRASLAGGTFGWGTKMRHWSGAVLAGAFALGSIGNAAAAIWSADTHTIAAGDFNGDGKSDLLVIAKDASQPSGIALGDGSGQPNVLHQSWSSSYMGVTWDSDTYVPHIGDFDGDNRDDIFLQRVSGGNHYILKPDASNKFTSIYETITNSALGINWSLAERRIEVGDYNNNGQDDLFLQSNNVGVDNVILLSTAGGSFPSVSHTWPNAYLNLEWALDNAIAHAGDFSGEGYADLLVQAKPNWAGIPFGKVVVPTPAYRSESYGIALSDGSGKATSISDTWNHNHLGLEWSPLQYEIFVGNFDGFCGDDILLQGKSAGMPSYIVLTSCAGLLQTSFHTLASGYLGLNWDATSYKFQVGDFNGDTRADIYMQALLPSGTNRIAYSAQGGNITGTPATHSTSGSFTQLATGALPGGFTVGNQGEGTYSIPITTPPATGGMKPNLELAPFL